MISVLIKRPFSKLVSRSVIKDTANRSIEFLIGADKFDLTIVIGSDKLLQALNIQYLGIDKPTDVLSFASKEIDPDTGIVNLGDIIISYQTAEKQALEAGHLTINEIRLLLIHGVLHLLGYDHFSTAEKEIMWKKQKALLDFQNIQINRIAGDCEFHD
ncbi:MAG: hypothetical protein FD147_161 [Chloroflexi bacterium]|nr:MAG: hypothetical protein FD147_161 [Chloroflexota bacterium]